MPRLLPPLARQFDVQCGILLDFSGRLELNFQLVKQRRARLSLTGLELSYELLYLRVFTLWEGFLEETFYRLLCGYEGSGGQEPRRAGEQYFRHLADAKTAVLGGRDYKLWHNPHAVIARSDGFFDPAGCRYRAALASSPNLAWYAAVRHRIAHSQDHAKCEFDAAAMALAGKRYMGSRPGRFLRDRDISQATRPRWLGVIARELSQLAHMVS